jgi:hypothetical protein
VAGFSKEMRLFWKKVREEWGLIAYQVCCPLPQQEIRNATYSVSLIEPYGEIMPEFAAFGLGFILLEKEEV